MQGKEGLRWVLQQMHVAAFLEAVEAAPRHTQAGLATWLFEWVPTQEELEHTARTMQGGWPRLRDGLREIQTLLADWMRGTPAAATPLLAECNRTLRVGTLENAGWLLEAWVAAAEQGATATPAPHDAPPPTTGGRIIALPVKQRVSLANPVPPPAAQRVRMAAADHRTSAPKVHHFDSWQLLVDDATVGFFCDGGRIFATGLPKKCLQMKVLDSTYPLRWDSGRQSHAIDRITSSRLSQGIEAMRRGEARAIDFVIG